MSSRSTSIPHRTSVSSTTSSQPSQSSQSQSKSQPHQRSHHPQRLTAQQLAERVISPGSVLFAHSPAPPPGRERLQQRRSLAEMDRRHPSSFQQLEKVCSHVLPTKTSVTLTRIQVRRGDICHGLQGPESTDRRTGRAQRDSPRFGRRHTLDRHPRNQFDERAQT